MRLFARLLRDGLRLALMLKPRALSLDADAVRWFALVAVTLLLDLALQWPLVDAPREFDGFGLQTALGAALLRLAASALLCRMLQRRALACTIACWFEAAALLPSLLAGAIFIIAGDDARLASTGWIAALAWLLLVLVRIGGALEPARVARVATGALLAFALVVLPWQWLEPQLLWRAAYDAGDFIDAASPGELAEPERVIYAQRERLDAALAALAPERPGHADLYLLAFGGDASEDVFRNEVEYAERLFAQRFDAAGRTLALLNHPDTAATRPLATVTNLERALRALGRRIDREHDVLFLYLTTHGSATHELYVNQPPLPLDQLTPPRLRAALDASGIRWRVVVVSACYAGGYVDALRDERTLVLAAARADRSSFGCGADSDITWFGDALLAHALNRTADFIEAFELARRQVVAWEHDENVEPSLPQIDVGARIAAQLERWRAGFTPGAALPFVPPHDAEPRSAPDAAPAPGDPPR